MTGFLLGVAVVGALIGAATLAYRRVDLLPPLPRTKDDRDRSALERALWAAATRPAAPLDPEVRS